MDRFRIRLRLGVTVMFLLIVVPLSSAMIGFIYKRNADLAREMAGQSMLLAAREITGKVSSVMNGMAQAVEMDAAFGKSRQAELRNPESLRPMMEQLQQMPGVFSLYFGMHEDGAFYQIIHPPQGIPFVSPSGKTAPKDANWVMRIVDDQSGRRRDTILYLAKWGKVVGLERNDAKYDPRERPWYQQALPAAGVIGTPVYLFAEASQPGLTLSRRLTTSDGGRLAVFGADMTIAALSAFLHDQKVGKTGRVFILDEEGRMIGHPDENKIIKTEGGTVRVLDGAAVKDTPAALAVSGLRAGNGNRFQVHNPDDGTDWLVQFTPFNTGFGSVWTIGVIVDEDEFTGPIKKASLTILFAGALFLILASGAILWASRLLVRPLDALVGEAESIRRLELGKPLKLYSPVIEIHSLAAAFASMKTALSSFGTYVPKSLVADIVRSGAGTSVGGSRRPLTVLFTDLQGFTAATESMPPEQVLPWLSTYFDAMSTAIHHHNGAIDKYIGDAVMALWNAPLEDENHVVNACRGMLACRDAADKITDTGVHLVTRMGLHTGNAVVGNVGASDRMQYTALGAMVNLASRVESLNKQLDTQLLVTGDVAKTAAPHFALRPMGRVLAVGTSQPIEVFELLGENMDLPEDVRLWTQALDLVRSGDFTQAAAKFEAFAALRPGDKAAALYLQALAAGPSWDGVLRFTDK